MKLRYKKVEIRYSQGAAVVQLIVPEWEVPVLQSIHDEINEISDIVADRPAPSVAAEMERLVALYGAERKEGGFTGIPYVEGVYGSHGVGINALKRAMQGAVLPSSTPATPIELSPQLRQDLLQTLNDTVEEVTDLIGDDGTEIAA